MLLKSTPVFMSPTIELVLWFNEGKCVLEFHSTKFVTIQKLVFFLRDED
jgi:hypothetical protein